MAVRATRLVDTFFSTDFIVKTVGEKVYAMFIFRALLICGTLVSWKKVEILDEQKTANFINTDFSNKYGAKKSITEYISIQSLCQRKKRNDFFHAGI